MHVEHTLGRALAGTGESIDFTGTWLNQLKSKMIIEQKSDTISGKYISKVSDTGGETTGKLAGFVDGDIISFIVHWNDFQAITSWVGQLEPNTAQQTINTLWQMTKQVATGDEWESINAGADTFTRISSAA
jgi:hypothetical protein